MSRYIVFDVETPNSRNDRMSAIGVAVVENGAITQEFYSLINPEAPFDDFNVRLTGISPEMVRDQPTFGTLWETLRPLLESGVLAAHYAPFDMGVLQKCLQAYGIQWKPYVSYACTCTMGRAAYPRLPNHKLNTLSGHVGIVLDHHHAGSDSRAAALLLIDYMQNGLDVQRYIRRFRLAEATIAKSKSTSPISEASTQLLALQALLKDITADGELSEGEITYLIEWVTHNGSLRGNYPFDQVLDILQRVLADGVLDTVEQQEMLTLFSQIIDPVINACNGNSFDIKGSTFCLTGEFAAGSRSVVEKKLAEKGGIPVKSVTAKTEYLIVGSLGSDAWAAGNYGNKIKKALEMQEKGKCIQIIRESDIQTEL